MSGGETEHGARRVQRDWTASYDPALAVRAGQTVNVGGIDPDHPGWRWVTDAHGLGGWVPDEIVDNAQIVEDFDTMEVSVSMGDQVTVLATRLGWCLVRKENGGTGWLPEACQ